MSPIRLLGGLGFALLSLTSVAKPSPVIGGTAEIGFVDLTSQGISVTRAGPALEDPNAYLIASGSAEPGTLIGQYRLQNAELDFRGTAPGVLTLTHFIFDTEAERFYADVTFDGALVRAAAPVFSFDLTGFSTAQIGNLFDPTINLKLGSTVGDLLLKLGATTNDSGTTIAVGAVNPLFAAAGVPEPGTWILLIGGFGLIYGAARRRGARSSA